MIRRLRRPELDLPLAEAPASRFLVWASAGLVYLAVLAFAVAALSDGRVSADADTVRTVGITLPAAEDPAAAAAETGHLLAALRALPGVAFAEPVPESEVATLVQPWLGAADRLPRLVDVAYNPGVAPDLAAVRAAAAAVAAGAEVEETGTATADPGPSRTLRLAGIVMGSALLLAGVALVVAVTRLSLTVHDDSVGLLRLLGAPDPYVARQFEQHALSRGLLGAVLGFAAAMLTLLAVAWLTGSIGPAGLRPVDWVLLACVPVVAVLLASLAARLTAMLGLARQR